MDWNCYRGYTYTVWKTPAPSPPPSDTKPNSRICKSATATLMPATLAECAPHQSRKGAECVRRLHISIKVSSSLTTACDMTVDAGRLRLKERPVRTRSGAGPGGCADVGWRAAPATATTTSSRTIPPGRSDTVSRRAAPATATAPAPHASGPAATGAATADHDRRIRSGRRMLCRLATGSLCCSYSGYLSTCSALLRLPVCLRTVFKRTSLSIKRHWLAVRLVGAEALRAVFLSWQSRDKPCPIFTWTETRNRPLSRAWL